MAALALTYSSALSSVVLSATSLGSAADVALFEHSTDQISWAVVRGGGAVPIVAGSASVSHYEFVPGVLNYYRCSAVDTTSPSYVAAGVAATANNASVAPALPAGYAEGDLLVVFAAIRNSGAGSVVTPSGWSVLLRVDNIALFGKRAGSGVESAPTVAVTGGVVNADVIAQMAAFRNAELTPAATSYQLNPSGQNITYPGLPAVDATWALALILGWKQDDWTSVATATGATAEIGEPDITTGDDTGIVWNYQLMDTTPVAVAPGAFVVTGGASAISYGATVALRRADYVTRTTATTTPPMTEVWLKFPGQPYLNRSVTLTGWTETSRASRVGVFPIVGRRDPVAAPDLHSPRTITVTLFADTEAEVAAIDLVLSTGNVMLLHIPPTCALKSMYASIGTYTYVKPASRSHKATFTIPLTEVAAPDLSIIGYTVTWATLITRYASWTDVVAANANWSAVLALTGSPADILVGT